jgi:hypothetical protein
MRKDVSNELIMDICVEIDFFPFEIEEAFGRDIPIEGLLISFFLFLLNRQVRKITSVITRNETATGQRKITAAYFE